MTKTLIVQHADPLLAIEGINVRAMRGIAL
jgi:hypothetical protein